MNKLENTRPWDTRQFVTADDPTAHDGSKTLVETLNSYIAVADRLLADAGAQPTMDVRIGPAPTFAMEFRPLNADAQRLLDTWPQPASVAMLIRAQCTLVAHASDIGLTEAAVANAMRLERLYLKLENALKIEPHAARGLKVMAGGKRRSSDVQDYHKKRRESIVAEFLRLTQVGEERRGIAGRIRRNLQLSITTHEINRILRMNGT